MDDFTNQSLSPINQSVGNPYVIIHEKKPIYRNQISLYKAIFITFLPLFLLLAGSVYPIIYFVGHNLEYLIPIILMPIPLLLFFCRSRIVLIKDKANNRLTVQERNYFCCKLKNYNIPLTYLHIRVSGDGGEYCLGTEDSCGHECSKITILNADPNVTDIDNNNIKNTPFKFRYIYYNLIGKSKDLNLF